MLKNTVKGIMVSGLVLGGMIAGATVTQPTQANASVRPTYSAKRNNSVKLVWRKSMKRHAFHTTKGALYSKHLGYKYANMSAYPKTTWYTIGHEKLHNKAKGTNPVYYQVVSKNGKHKGWVYRGYLKKGAYKSSTAKSDGYYKNLADQLTADARKKVASGNTGTKTKTNTKTNNSGSKTPTKTPSVPKMSEAQYNSEVASAFLSQLNIERTKRGLAPAVMTEGSETQQIAEGRIPQLLSQQTAGGSAVLNHYYGGHLAPMALAKQLGYKGVVPSESLAGKWANDGSDVTTGTLPSDLGKELVHMLIYEDSASGNGHRATLLAADYTHVGIAVGQASGKVVLVSEHSAK